MRSFLAVGVTVALVASACTSTDSVETTTSIEAVAPKATTVVATEPVFSVLDSGVGGVDYVGHMPRLVIPPDGLPFVVYLSHDQAEEGSEDWVYVAAKCVDYTCSGEVSTTAFDVRGWGQHPSVTVGPDGLPAFVYLDVATEEEDMARMEQDPIPPPDNRLHLVRCLDSACVEHTDTDLGPGQSASLVVPADGLPLVAFNELEQNETVVLKCEDPACTESAITQLEGMRFAFGTLLRLGPDGLPMLGLAKNQPLTEETAGDIRPGLVSVFYCSDETCSGGELITVAETTENPELVGWELGTDGPEFGLGGLSFVRCLDMGCSQIGPTSLIGPPHPSTGVAMAIAPDGLAVFVYGTEVREGGNILAVAKCTDPDCTEGTIATLEETWVFDLSLALDAGGNPVIAYYAPPELKVVTCADAGCVGGAVDVKTWDQESSEVEPGEPVGEVMKGWSALPNEGGVFGPGGGGSMRQIVLGGPGVLAFGTTCEIEEGQTGECLSGVWASEDGLAWEQVENLGPVDVRAVTAGGPGFVAVGSTCTFGPEGPPPDCAPAIWTSSEGTEWARVAHDEDLFPSCLQVDEPFCQLSIDNLLVLPSGELVASGFSAEGLTVWTSPDGLAWTRSEEPFLPFGSDLRDWWVDELIVVGPQLIATGAECREVTVAYLGVSTRSNEAGSGVVVEDVVAGSAAEAAGLEINDVIVRFDGEPVADKIGPLITSRQPGDNVTLTVLREGSEIDLEATLGESDDFFCTALLAQSLDGAEWTSVDGVISAEGDSFFGRFTEWARGWLSISTACDRSYNCESLLVTSQDGVAWQSRPLGDTFEGIELSRVFSFGDGLLGIGGKFDEILHEEQPLFAVSPNGEEWTLYAADPEVFPERIGINDLVEFSGRFLGVGADRGGPAVWVYEPPE